MSTTQDLVNYYANLLILQYLQKPNAYATVQAVASQALLPQTTVQSLSFSTTPTSGSFVLNYGSLATSAIAYNATAAQIQTALQALTGLSSVTVAGSPTAGPVVVTFTGVPPVATLLTVTSNTLAPSVTTAVILTDVTLPLAIQNAFNLTGSTLAQGTQLNTLGKYAGVVRTGQGVSGPVTLSDADFLIMIQFATLVNSAGSSLATIQALLYQIFPNEVFVFDYKNMHMSYFINSSIGSQNLIQLVINAGLLPKPMGVSLSTTVYTPTPTAFFGMRTYQAAAMNSEPLNSYTSFHTSWLFLSYQNGIGYLNPLTDESGNFLVQEDGTSFIYAD